MKATCRFENGFIQDFCVWDGKIFASGVMSPGGGGGGGVWGYAILTLLLKRADNSAYIWWMLTFIWVLIYVDIRHTLKLVIGIPSLSLWQIKSDSEIWMSFKVSVVWARDYTAHLSSYADSDL